MVERYELMEEYQFVKEFEDWKVDARLNEALEDLEESIEGSELKPVMAWDWEHDPEPDKQGRPPRSPESRPEPVEREEAIRPSWIDPGMRRRGRRGGGGSGRGRKPSIKESLSRGFKLRSGSAYVECPKLRELVTGDECQECEYDNREKWLEDPGKEDRCTHPDYYTYAFEEGPDSGDS